MKNPIIACFALGAIILLALCAYDIQRLSEQLNTQKTINTFLVKKNIVLQSEVNSLFSDYNLKTQLEKHNVKFPHIVYNQARLETGNFTSNVMFNYHNLFGFTRQSIMKFDTWIDCVIFYKQWQDKYFTKETEDEYYQLLTNHPFSGSPHYAQTLKNMQNDDKYKKLYVSTARH